MSRERAIIETIARVLGDPDALANDAWLDPDTRLIYTTDMMVEGEHFRLDYFTPANLGWKAAAVNISDIAAMGGELRYLLVSLGLPQQTPTSFVEGLYEGLKSAADRYGGRIIGGDTVAAPQMVVNVTAIGWLPDGHRLGERHQARPGDRIIATGHHGLSYVGLQAFLNGLAGYPAARQAHLRPVPRVAEGLALSGSGQRYALMDSSDGLADALLKMALGSGVRMVVREDAIPLHPEVLAWAEARQADPWQAVLYGGEDFELVAAVPEDLPVPDGFQVIGTVGDGEPGAILLRADGSSVPLSLERTYQHFRESK